MTIEVSAAEKLATKALYEFGKGPWPVMEGWGHIGAILSDTGLNAAVNYEAVVRPRVERLIALHPNAKTTSGFADVCNSPGLYEVLNWKGHKKVLTIQALTGLLLREGVETPQELAQWYVQPGSRHKLADISGMGPKLIDYLGSLLGVQRVAIDRWLTLFLEYSGIDTSILTYERQAEIYYQACEILDVTPKELDFSVWCWGSQLRNKANSPLNHWEGL